ncbi:MAG: right-handed parallel beta-helix repeat-containing protein [Phycisphaerales bacterium]|nr:right-handed parallel beta-helix repeat-containing protein [Phycisphaerales bacterium]MCB9856491.1 right-handed parallel beta-helix repeat-containing protein [Phycisphaerales bacterium]MCB9863972.1 right-handed parallel beta-helix repeat-containing protein [Phycisphaerales bacterium]
MKRTRLYPTYMMAAALNLWCAAAVSAATINVPADQATISGAIAAASPGDTILVAPGTYDETLNINVADLTIISTGGRDVTTISNNAGAANPIVTIAAPGTTLGLTGQGFRIRHLTANAQRVIHVASAMIGFPGVDNANPTTIEGNRIVGSQVGAGIYSDAAIAEITFNIEGNIFSRAGGAYSFAAAMYFDDTSVGSVGNAVLYTASLNILGNVVQNLSDYGVYFDSDSYTSDILIDGNTFGGLGMGVGFGFYCSDYLYDHTNMSFTNNIVDGVDEGFHFYEVENGSTLHVDDNTFTDFANYGVSVEYVYYGSDLTINRNTITGDGTADYGIYTYYYDEGCSGQVNNNDISGVDYAGIYQEYMYYSIVDVVGNTIVGNSADYGIFQYYCEASLFDVLNNNVSGYDDYGLYTDDYLQYGGIYRFNGNTFTGDGTGDGMYFSDYFEYGPYVEINDNTITKFDNYGIYIDEVYEGGTCKVNNNNLTAQANSATATGIYWEYIEDGGGTGEVVGNTVNMNGSGYDGMYFYTLNYGADLLVDDNTVTGYKRYGLFFDDYIEYGASATITNNTFHAHVATGSEYGIYISDYVAYGADLVVSNNDIKDFYDYGIYVYEVYEGSSAEIDGNTLSARPNPMSCTGIYVDTTEYGSDTWIRDNMVDVNNAADDAIYLYYIGYGSNVNVTGNTCLDYQNAGLYVDDVVEYSCSLVVSDNTLTPAAAVPSAYGIYLDDYVEYGSYFECERNNISRFTDYGIRTSYIYDGSDIVCDDNIIAGDAAGADYGIYISDEIEYGNFFSSISGNTISNIRNDGGDMAGIYFYELYEGAFVDVFKNNITSHADGASYGIEAEYVEYGSVLDFSLNTIAGFEKAGFYFDSDVSYGPIVRFRNNDVSGGEAGILFNDYIDEGAEVYVESNFFDGFTEYGVRFNDYIDASIVNIDRNWFFGGVAGARGVRTFADLDEGAVLSINDNCFKDLSDGVVIFDILETAIAVLRGNDFSGVSGAAVINENGDADHFIDAILNYLNGAGTGGNVNVAPELASAPDLDGDGVPNCDDMCPNTAAGAAVDADGCPLPPADDNMNDNGGNGNGNDNGGDNGNDNGGPAPQPAPECGCGNGGMLMMPLAAVGFAGLRRRVRRSRRTRA